MDGYKRSFETPNMHIPPEDLPLGIEKRGELAVYQGVSREAYAERLEEALLTT